MLDRTLAEDGYIRGAASDVDQAHTQVPFVIGQGGLRRSQGLEDDVHYVETGPVGALHDVLRAGHRRRHDVDLGFEPDAAHSQWLPDSVLVVDDELLGDHMDHLTVHRDRHRLGGIDDPPDVTLAYFAVLDRHDAVGIEGTDVPASDPRIHRRDLAVRHQLRFLDRMLDRVHGGVDVDDHSLAETPRRMGTDPNHIQAVLGALRHDHTDFRGADVESDDQLFLA